MKNLMTVLLSLILFTISFFCCKKASKSNCKYDAIPSSLILKFLKNGTLIADNVLSSIKLSYFDGSTKKYVTDFAISTDTANQNKGLKASRNIGILSANNNIKVFYIEYSNGWINDTLVVDYLSNSLATNCLYVQKSVKYKGRETGVDTAFHFDSPVHVLNKE